MQRLGRLIVLFGCVAWFAACTSVSPPADLNQGAPTHTVHVFSNGWHTGIVVARKDLPLARVPEAADFPEAAYLEFGWGDREYYPSPRPTVGMALSAALTPTPAVIHLAGLGGPPQMVDLRVEVVAVRLTTAAFERLVVEIDATFDRPAGGRAKPVAPGLYEDSLFYTAHGRFHLFNTCNTWTAWMLAAAGVDVSPAGVMTAEDLMGRLRDLPNVSQPSFGGRERS